MTVFILFMLGLCFGSFVNALVWRLHEQEEQLTADSSQLTVKPKDKKSKQSDLSILSGRSMCPNCKHTLAWYDLLPVVSWLSLRGKCRYCRKPISWQYPLVELATACLFVLSFAFWPTSLQSPASMLQFAMWLLFLVGFMALLVYDMRWMMLPNRIVFPLQGLALIYVLVQVIFLGGGWGAALGAALGVLCSAGLFYLLYQVSRGKWIGGGDVKLAVVLGLLLGSPAYSLLMIFIASCLGTLISLPLLVSGKVKQTTRLPFGPLLIVATIIVYLFGATLLAWYERQFIFV